MWDCSIGNKPTPPHCISTRTPLPNGKGVRRGTLMVSTALPLWCELFPEALLHLCEISPYEVLRIVRSKELSTCIANRGIVVKPRYKNYQHLERLIGIFKKAPSYSEEYGLPWAANPVACMRSLVYGTPIATHVQKLQSQSGPSGGARRQLNTSS